MEKEIKIKISENKYIYGTLNFHEQHNNRLIILVHGLFDNANSRLMTNASKFFNENKYATFRINLYHYKPDARHFSECSMSTHASDINRAINHFKNEFKFIYLTGHSYGSLAILLAKPDQAVKAISLWELSSFISQPPTYFEYNSSLKKYILNLGFDALLEKKYIESLKQFPNELELINQIKIPIQLAYAAGDRGALKESSVRYYQHICSDKELLPIANASHSFPEEGAENGLFSGTLHWISRF